MKMRNLLIVISDMMNRCGNLIRFFRKPIHIGKKTKISLKSTIRISRKGGSIKIGDNCTIGDYSYLLTYGGVISLGNNCSVNMFSILYGHGGLRIGNYVRIAANVIIIPANHNFSSLNQPICYQGTTSKGVIIDDDVWIGVGCRILDGVHIGKGCVIGAGSVVTRSIPSFSIVAGVPARVIRIRKDNSSGENTLG